MVLGAQAQAPTAQDQEVVHGRNGEEIDLDMDEGVEEDRPMEDCDSQELGGSFLISIILFSGEGGCAVLNGERRPGEGARTTWVPAKIWREECHDGACSVWLKAVL